MNNVTITVEFCAEDRARLDKLIAVEEARAAQTQALLEMGYDNKAPQNADINKMLTDVLNPTTEATTEEAPKNATGAAEIIDPPTLDPFPETSTEAEPAPATPVKEVKLEDIQAKIVDLAVAGKKDKAREVVHSYGVKRATDLPPETYAEVLAKLTALEG